MHSISAWVEEAGAEAGEAHASELRALPGVPLGSKEVDPERGRLLGAKRQRADGEVARHEAGQSRETTQLRELGGLAGVVGVGPEEAEEVSAFVVQS